MCDGGISTIAIAGLALTAASTGVAAYSQYQATESQNKANEYNAAALNRNAEQANLQAQHLIDQGAVDEKVHRQKVQQLIGTQRASAAGSGLLVDNGTTEDVVEDTAGFGELDALTIRNNAARSAWGARNTGADYSASANLATMKNSSSALSVGGSLLSGGSQMYNQLYQNKKFGSQN